MMMKFKVMLIIIALFVITQMVVAAATVDVQKYTITATGTAKLDRKPDVAYITLYVKGSGILMVDAIKKAAEKTGEIEKALKEKHKEIKDIQIQDISLGEKNREMWSSDQKEETPRPEVTKQIRITIPVNIDLAAEIIDTAMRTGAVLQKPSSVHYSGEIDSVVVFGLNDESSVINEAKKKAVEDAKDKAKQTAVLLGKTVGDVVSIGCGGSSSFSSIRINGQETDFPGEYVSVNPNKITISQCIPITFELKNK
jgi:uncharacterized protein